MVVTVEGVRFLVAHDLPKVSDWYIGTYEAGVPTICVAREVDMENKWVVPDNGRQPHEFNECKRVVRIIGEPKN